MSYQHVAKLIFCSMCLFPFTYYADFLPYEFAGSKYAVADQNALNDGSLGASEFPLSAFDGYIAPNVASNRFKKYHNANQSSVKQTKSVRLGLQNAIKYLKNHKFSRAVSSHNVTVSNRQLADTANALMNWRGAYNPEAMKNNFYMMDLTQNNRSKSQFTGYYTPTILAQLHSDSEYRYPIYKSPMSKQRFFSRKQIVAGALANKGLEVAWTNDPVGLFYLQIQGSGVLQLPNGDIKSLVFNGSNEKKFKSVARYMKNRGLINGNPSRTKIKKWLDRNPNAMDNILNINPRYIYFTLSNGSIKTASGMPVVAGHTVAVDTNYIPFGSVVLAEVPIINSLGKRVGNEWRVLFPQDRGDAIKGPARMDIYTGAGDPARKMANKLTGYRKAYLIINKPKHGQSYSAIN